MRRLVFGVLGLLELAACGLLAYFAWMLPGPGDVEEAVGRVKKVSDNTSRQVRTLRQQVTKVRRRQPELLALSRRLEQQMKVVNANLHGRPLGGEGLDTASTALGDVARGLDGLGTVLDPRNIGSVGKGLGSTADYLDGKAIPAAEKAADTLEKASASLKKDSARVKEALGETPGQLEAARSVVASLKRFEDGLARMKKIARPDNLEAMDEGFKGLEKSLDTGADQVENVADYTIPKVTVKGLKITVEERDFWPEGKEIAAGMRKAAKGCAAAQKEMATLKKEMPKLRESLTESEKMVKTTRQALDTALARQEKLDPLLKTLPANLAKLIEDLPTVLGELARILRETARLKEAATALRQAQQGVEAARKQWPQLGEGLKQSAALVRATQAQLKSALARRDEYEATIQQTVELTTLFAAALPVLVEQLEEGLEQQEAALDDLGNSIDSVSAALPPAAQSASRLLVTTRWLLGVVALVVGLHAAYLLLGSRLGPAYSGLET
jgi:uncharacterized phage infection (PIP) family protein YhgE